jgi:predicted RNA-binding protein (virulence factor B family)
MFNGTSDKILSKLDTKGDWTPLKDKSKPAKHVWRNTKIKNIFQCTKQSHGYYL